MIGGIILTEWFLPFILVFVICFAILEKSKILGNGVSRIDALVSLAVGFLAVSLPYSRDVIVDIFYVILHSSEELDSESVRQGVIEFRKENKLPLVGVAGSNVRRQLKRLRDMYFVEKVRNKYRIAEKEKISHIFEQKIEKFYLQAIISRVKEYIDALE